MVSPIVEVIWCFEEEADQKQTFRYIEDNCKQPVKFIKGFPDEKIRSGKLIPNDGQQRVLVLDDLSTVLFYALTVLKS